MVEKIEKHFHRQRQIHSQVNMAADTAADDDGNLRAGVSSLTRGRFEGIENFSVVLFDGIHFLFWRHSAGSFFPYGKAGASLSTSAGSFPARNGNNGSRITFSSMSQAPLYFFRPLGFRGAPWPMFVTGDTADILPVVVSSEKAFQRVPQPAGRDQAIATNPAPVAGFNITAAPRS
jgi:hypothetical protein